jgi:hypothetical protein
MPTYTLYNNTPYSVWVRCYTPGKYILRSKTFDPYFWTSMLAVEEKKWYTQHERDVIFKVVVPSRRKKVGIRTKLKSGNCTIAKKNKYTDEAWQNAKILLTIGIDTANTYVTMEAGAAG